MIIFLLVLAILTAIISFFYSRYLYGRILARLSFIEACPGLYDKEWWLDEN